MGGLPFLQPPINFLNNAKRGEVQTILRVVQNSTKLVQTIKVKKSSNFQKWGAGVMDPVVGDIIRILPVSKDIICMLQNEYSSSSE